MYVLVICDNKSLVVIRYNLFDCVELLRTSIITCKKFLAVGSNTCIALNYYIKFNLGSHHLLDFHCPGKYHHQQVHQSLRHLAHYCTILPILYTVPWICFF